ncbi:MAG: ABC transporter permease, partial [Vicinamibacterales bacterium]
RRACWSAGVIRQVLAVGSKELRQIVRDRRTLVILLFVPAFFLLLYGYALNFDIRHLRLAVQDRDRSTASRELVSSFANSGYFDFVGQVDSDAELERLIDRNEVRLVLTIPAGFARDLEMLRPTTVQVVIDGDNANTASTAMGYARAIVGNFSAARLVDVAPRRMASGSTPVPTAPAPFPITAEPRIWYNPSLKSALFLVPGLIAYISMITAVVSTALSVVREKERGTMEQVRMAPLSPAAYIIGKTLPYLAIAFVSALLIILTSMALFELPMNGSWALLILAIGLFLVGAQAQGLLVSTIAETQQVAFQLALLSSFLPTFILSGFIFPISSMPAAVQAITHVVPARYFLVALRAIVLKGAGILAFWEDLSALAIFATVALALAALRLKREWA